MDDSFKNQKCSNNKNSFKNVLMKSGRKFNLIETDDGKQFVRKILIYLLNQKDFQRYSRKTSPGDIFAEKFNPTIRDLLKRSIFQLRDGNWFDILPTIT